MGIFVQDSFTGAAGTLLTAHTGEVGGWITDSNLSYDAAGAKLDGSGLLYAIAGGVTPHQTSIMSGVVAPQMDYYVECNINVGVVSAGEVMDFGEHYHPGTFNSVAGPQFYFDSTVTNVRGPLYCKGNTTALAAVADNSAHVIRVEYRFSSHDFKIFFDGVLVHEENAPISGTYAPATVGHFAMNLDSSYVPSGNGLQIDSVELGTIATPTAFWTDLTGSLVETIGA